MQAGVEAVRDRTAEVSVAGGVGVTKGCLDSELAAAAVVTRPPADIGVTTSILVSLQFLPPPSPLLSWLDPLLLVKLRKCKGISCRLFLIDSLGVAMGGLCFRIFLRPDSSIGDDDGGDDGGGGVEGGSGFFGLSS